MKRSLRILQSEASDSHNGVALALGGWLGVATVTAVVCLILWRLSLALGSPLILCAGYALPAALSMRSMAKAMASFFAVTIVGIALLNVDGVGGRLGFVLAGMAFAAAVLYVTVGAGEKLAEARKALGIIRLRASTVQDSIQRAGVCMVVIGRNMTWSSVNEAAWTAFGSDARLRSGVDARVELDDEAATALMHSGSRETWRSFREAVTADAARVKLQPGQALPPYRLSLYDIAGKKTRYRFVVSMGQREEMVFVGFPDSSRETESVDDQTPEAWFNAAVASIGEPSVVLQSDGAILAANGAFLVLCGNDSPAYIFDCPRVRGLTELTFITSVWLPTRQGATDLNTVYLDGAGQAVGARIAPPKAAYTEAVLIVFKEGSRPVPDGFTEVTKSVGL